MRHAHVNSVKYGIIPHLELGRHGQEEGFIVHVVPTIHKQLPLLHVLVPISMDHGSGVLNRRGAAILAYLAIVVLVECVHNVFCCASHSNIRAVAVAVAVAAAAVASGFILLSYPSR